MIKEKKSLKNSTSSRRKFFKTAAKAGAVAAATVAMPNIATAGSHAKVLKMQAAWPSGANIFFEMAGDYCNMVKEMSGGSLQIDLQPVGAVVKTSEIGQAVSSGVVDMGHAMFSCLGIFGGWLVGGGMLGVDQAAFWNGMQGGIGIF